MNGMDQKSGIFCAGSRVSVALAGCTLVFAGGCLPDNFWVGLSGDMATTVFSGLASPIVNLLAGASAAFMGA